MLDGVHLAASVRGRRSSSLHGIDGPEAGSAFPSRTRGRHRALRTYRHLENPHGCVEALYPQGFVVVTSLRPALCVPRSNTGLRAVLERWPAGAQAGAPRSNSLQTNAF